MLVCLCTSLVFSYIILRIGDFFFTLVSFFLGVISSPFLIGVMFLPFTGVFADGPGAYLFHGVVDQQYVFHVMDYALCLSESKQKSCEKHVTRGGKPHNNNKTLCSKSGTNTLTLPLLYVLLLIAALWFF